MKLTVHFLIAFIKTEQDNADREAGSAGRWVISHFEPLCADLAALTKNVVVKKDKSMSELKESMLPQIEWEDI